MTEPHSFDAKLFDVIKQVNQLQEQASNAVTDAYTKAEVDSKFALLSHTHNVGDLETSNSTIEDYSVNSFVNNNELFYKNVFDEIVLRTVPEGDWEIKMDIDIIAGLSWSCHGGCIILSSEPFNETWDGVTITGGSGCAEGIKIQIPEPWDQKTKVTLLVKKAIGFNLSQEPTEENPIVGSWAKGTVFDERYMKGNAFRGYMFEEIKPILDDFEKRIKALESPESA